MKLKADAATLQFRLPKSRPCGQSQDYKAGWSLGYVSAIDSNGRTIWIADAHRGYGKRFVVRADEKLTTCALTFCKSAVSGSRAASL
jgi:hypothetical protein